MHDHTTLKKKSIRRWRHALTRLPPGRRPGTHGTGGWVDLGVGLDGCGKYSHHISKSLHRLKKPGPHSKTIWNSNYRCNKNSEQKMYDDINLLWVLKPIYACLLECDKEKRNKIVAFVWFKGQHKFLKRKISRELQHNATELIRHHLSVIHCRHWGPRSRLSSQPVLGKTGCKELRENVQYYVYRITALQPLIYDSDKCTFRQKNVLSCQQVKRDHKQIPEHLNIERYMVHVQTCWLPNKRVRHLCRIDHKGITKLLSTPKNSYTLNDSLRRDRSQGWKWHTWLLLTVWQSLSMGRHAVWQLGTNVSEEPVSSYFTV
jgi:hypothetical protein